MHDKESSVQAPNSKLKVILMATASIPPERKYKILLLGPGNVGKTSLVRNFVEKRFSEDYLPSIGANLFVKMFTFPYKNDKLTVQLTIWDIAGQAQFQPMLATYYKGAKGAFFVADLTSIESFHLLPNWYADFIKNVPEPVPTVLLANKCDLEAVVGDGTISTAADDVRASCYFKTSAKTSENVIEAFTTLTHAILDKYG